MAIPVSAECYETRLLLSTDPLSQPDSSSYNQLVSSYAAPIEEAYVATPQSTIETQIAGFVSTTSQINAAAQDFQSGMNQSSYYTLAEPLHSSSLSTTTEAVPSASTLPSLFGSSDGFTTYLQTATSVATNTTFQESETSASSSNPSTSSSESIDSALDVLNGTSVENASQPTLQPAINSAIANTLSTATPGQTMGETADNSDAPESELQTSNNLRSNNPDSVSNDTTANNVSSIPEWKPFVISDDIAIPELTLAIAKDVADLLAARPPKPETYTFSETLSFGEPEPEPIENEPVGRELWENGTEEQAGHHERSWGTVTHTILVNWSSPTQWTMSETVTTTLSTRTNALEPTGSRTSTRRHHHGTLGISLNSGHSANVTWSATDNFVVNQNSSWNRSANGNIDVGGTSGTVNTTASVEMNYGVIATTLADGRAARTHSLILGGDRTSDMSVTGNYKISEASGTIMPPGSTTVPRRRILFGGNGDSFNANAEVSLSANSATEFSFNASATVPDGYELDDSMITGNIDLSHDIDSTGSLSEDLHYIAQTSSGNPLDDTDEYDYIDIGYNDSASGTVEFTSDISTDLTDDPVVDSSSDSTSTGSYPMPGSTSSATTESAPDVASTSSVRSTDGGTSGSTTGEFNNSTTTSTGLVYTVSGSNDAGSDSDADSVSADSDQVSDSNGGDSTAPSVTFEFEKKGKNGGTAWLKFHYRDIEQGSTFVDTTTFEVGFGLGFEATVENRLGLTGGLVPIPTGSLDVKADFSISLSVSSIENVKMPMSGIEYPGYTHTGWSEYYKLEGTTYTFTIGVQMSANLTPTPPTVDLSGSVRLTQTDKYHSWIKTEDVYDDGAGNVVTFLSSQGECRKVVLEILGPIDPKEPLGAKPQVTTKLLNSWSQIGTFPTQATQPTAVTQPPALTTALDRIQLGLDILGMIPVVGEAADAINLGIHIGRGNWGDAALSAAAMIPGLGGAVTAGKLAAKGGKQIVKHADEGVKVVRGFTKQADDVIEGACKQASNCFIAGTQVVRRVRRTPVFTVSSGVTAESAEVPAEDEQSLGISIISIGLGAACIRQLVREGQKSPFRRSRGRGIYTLDTTDDHTLTI